MSSEKQQVIRAFWHKGRRVFLSCTMEDIANRTGLSLVRCGQIMGGLAKQDIVKRDEGSNIYDLTEAGRAAVFSAVFPQPETKRVSMLEMARAEGHMPGLPKVTQETPLNESQVIVLATIKAHGPLTRAGVVEASGLANTHVPQVLQTLKARCLIDVVDRRANPHTYIAVHSEPDSPSQSRQGVTQREVDGNRVTIRGVTLPASTCKNLGVS